MASGFSGKRWIVLEDEIKYLELYLSFEKLRMVDHLSFEIFIDTSIDKSQTLIGVMMIQPFLENAIWHGIQPLKSQGLVTLHIDKKNEKIFTIKVIDNGIGIQESYTRYNILDIPDSELKFNCIAIQRLRLLKKPTEEP